MSYWGTILTDLVAIVQQETPLNSKCCTKYQTMAVVRSIWHVGWTPSFVLWCNTANI